MVYELEKDAKMPFLMVLHAEVVKITTESNCVIFRVIFPTGAHREPLTQSSAIKSIPLMVTAC